MILLRKLKALKISYHAAAKLQSISRNILASIVYLLTTSCSSKVPFEILK